MKRAHLFISGKVQGVFFRAFTKEVADSLGLKGWVRNLTDGRVEAVFEGEEKKINLAIQRCKQGPPAAIVDNIEVIWEQPEGYQYFEIRRTS
ncbi:MAG TPA: acylphosphatase [Thermodesulfovibrio thiophilus]|uniref:acylphosphatase n=1 Tax=Thermodesulfovibrio thiophilus TaxID=340095 RepID=UPI0003F6EB21|nr:acylphosphatase [Thermodesulfovibrio thiophilus]HHW19547.1 acylphosphatase [Thermodesulfovibrio thiophilus]HOA82356.1 acylphosphatase [Thermodesulfovibrio thiophilus]HQA03614.1 acylphosphatase [Thermodesulfovibrio thiophilus]HQD35841.1 acylphosphatase [Thermodesulfovibrio thiophilus]